MAVLVDTNVLLDIFTDDPVWADWSGRKLNAAIHAETAVINAAIYAELSVGFPTLEMLDETLQRLPLRMREMPRPALFLAGKSFAKYRERRGAKTGVLPDFFIGAHAAVAGFTLLTRDAARYRAYFPRLKLIAP